MEKVNGVGSKNLLKGFNVEGLYEQFSVLDPDAGEIKVLKPITAGWVRDTERPLRFFSSIIGTRRGQPQQVPFEIQAGSLEEAVGKWIECATAAAEEFHRLAEEHEIRSRLAVPAGARLQPN